MLPDIDNGHVTFTDNTRYTSVAIYSCDEGFRLSSPNGRYCQMDGTWSDDEPTCDRCEYTKYIHANGVCILYYIVIPLSVYRELVISYIGGATLWNELIPHI